VQNSNTLVYIVNDFLKYIFLLSSVQFCCIRNIEIYRINYNISAIIHVWFRVLNFTSLASRPGFVEFAHTVWKVERAWPTVLLFIEEIFTVITRDFRFLPSRKWDLRICDILCSVNGYLDTDVSENICLIFKRHVVQGEDSLCRNVGTQVHCVKLQKSEDLIDTYQLFILSIYEVLKFA
jgi:hypothetical protein